MSDIAISAGVRTNLLALQQTKDLLTTSQSRLATGRKVNTALDNPGSFFTAKGLSTRADALTSLLDGISNAQSVLKSANTGLTSITNLIKSLQGNIRSALQDSSGTTPGTVLTTSGGNTSTAANNQVSFDLDGSGPAAAITVQSWSTAATNFTGSAAAATITSSNQGDMVLTSSTLSGGVKVSVAAGDSADAIVSKINAALDQDANGKYVRATNNSGTVQITDFKGNTVSVNNASGNQNNTVAAVFTSFGAVAGAGATGAALTDQLLADAINGTSALSGKVKAGVSGGSLTVQNLTGANITMTGISNAGAVNGASGTSGTLTAGGSTLSATRQSLSNQYNELRKQLDQLANDSGFNGTNLLKGDKITVKFNELSGNNLSSLTISAQNSDGTDFGSISTTSLGIGDAKTQTNTAGTIDFADNTSLNSAADQITKALGTLQNISSQLGSSLSIVQNRSDFTKNIVDTLNSGADSLTLADTNAEAANVLALQTRQQLSQSALSLANQADQAVLRLFG